MFVDSWNCLFRMETMRNENRGSAGSFKQRNQLGLRSATLHPPLSIFLILSGKEKQHCWGLSHDSEMKNDLWIQRNVWRNPPGIGEENMGSGSLFPLFLFTSLSVSHIHTYTWLGPHRIDILGNKHPDVLTVLLLMKFLLLRG